MRRILLVGPFVLVGLAVGIGYWNDGSETQAKPEDKPHKAFGIDKHVPWTTSHVKGSPEPPAPYRLENAFPKIKFDFPLEMVALPGTKLFLVAEQHGKLFTFENRRDASAKHLLHDEKCDVYSVTVHPKFAENRYIYLTAIREDEKPEGIELLRYTLTKTSPPKLDPKSKLVILKRPCGGHNGGCLRFGNDGYLYVGTGDGSGIADQLETGQNLGEIRGKILRIEVDKTEGGKNYGIPKDNPFVGVKGARPEIWSYGHRQPWRFEFDRPTGDLWVGEVGQDLWEMIWRIEKGGNYGWSVQEGSHPFRPMRKKGPDPFQTPIVEHDHNDFRSITGGFVYHGKQRPELQGAYVYGDYDTGRVWMLRYDSKATKVTEHREMVDTQLRIVAWSQDLDGEIYAVDHQGGGFHKIMPARPQAANGPKFPRKLSETGLFTSTKDMMPAPGVIPYSVNAELWSDGALKWRYMAIPGDAKIDFEAMTYPQPAPGASPGWRFPDGTVMVKTFALELEAGNPKSAKRLETRLLVGERVLGSEDVGDQVWSGYTYLWNDEQTDAELIDAKGLNVKYEVKDPAVPGGQREQTWHFPSRAECTLCHTMSAKYVLGMNTLQANRDQDYGDCVANQIATFEHIGLFSKPLPERPEKMPKLANYLDTTADLDARARSYLHANCSHCHRKWGGGNAAFQLLYPLKLEETGIVNVKANHGTFDLKDPKLLVPGEPDRSLVYHRMRILGLGRMPHVASNVVDRQGVAIVREWIEKMPK